MTKWRISSAMLSDNVCLSDGKQHPPSFIVFPLATVASGLCTSAGPK